jgi:Helix-turn-helix domain
MTHDFPILSKDQVDALMRPKPAPVGERALALMTAHEVARELHVATATLAGWRVRGEGPSFVKIAGKILYRRGDVESFILGRLRTSTADKGAA